MGCEHPKLHVLMVFIDFCPENPFKLFIHGLKLKSSPIRDGFLSKHLSRRMCRAVGTAPSRMYVPMCPSCGVKTSKM